MTELSEWAGQPATFLSTFFIGPPLLKTPRGARDRGTTTTTPFRAGKWRDETTSRPPISNRQRKNADDDSQKLDEVNAALHARNPHPFVWEAPPTARSPLVRDSQPLTDVSGKAAR